MNYKNKLQELSQKNKVPLPKYISESTNIIQHSPTWISTVIYDGQSYISLTSSSKKESEQSAAKNALDTLTQNELIIPKPILQVLIPQVPIPDAKSTSHSKYIILIDLENIQPKIPKLSSKYNVYCFLSSYSSVDTQKYLQHNICVIDNGASEATDHLMSYTAGQLAFTEDPNDCLFVIVSRDKSSSVLVGILQSKSFQVLHYKKATDFEEFLTL